MDKHALQTRASLEADIGEMILEESLNKSALEDLLAGYLPC